MKYKGDILTVSDVLMSLLPLLKRGIVKCLAISSLLKCQIYNDITFNAIFFNINFIGSFIIERAFVIYLTILGNYSWISFMRETRNYSLITTTWFMNDISKVTLVSIRIGAN